MKESDWWFFCEKGLVWVLSTSDLSVMPEIDDLRDHLQKVAAIAAVFADEDEEPQFTYDPAWGKSEQLAANINGSGDELYVHFTRKGCFIKGFAHESKMSPYCRKNQGIWPGVIDSVPKDFKSSLKEPAFDPEATTFVIWRLHSSDEWSIGDIKFPKSSYKDGSADLLAPIAFSASDLAEWLTENYEVDIDVGIVQSVFDGGALVDSQLSKLNPQCNIKHARKAVKATGWKVRSA